eukprot:m.61772 g.61772  ORF g.61772 m.61772 type:complete len:425 (-) comp11444_c0_seq4:68-1342(-)
MAESKGAQDVPEVKLRKHSPRRKRVLPHPGLKTQQELTPPTEPKPLRSCESVKDVNNGKIITPPTRKLSSGQNPPLAPRVVNPDFAKFPESLREKARALHGFVSWKANFVYWLKTLEKVFGKLATTPQLYAPLRNLILTAPPLTLVNETLLPALEAKLDPKSDLKVGEILKVHAAKIAVFSAFCGQYQAAEIKLQESREDGSHVHLLIEEFEQEKSCGGLSFLELCSLPSLHLNEYPEKLNTLLDATGSQTHEYTSLSEACEIIKKEIEITHKDLLNLRNTLSATLLHSRLRGDHGLDVSCLCRELLKQGQVTWTQQNQPARDVQLFLFSKLLLVARKDGRNRNIELENVRNPKTSAIVSTIFDGPLRAWRVGSRGFFLQHKRPLVLFEFEAQTEKEANEWVSCISQTNMETSASEPLLRYISM